MAYDCSELETLEEVYDEILEQMENFKTDGANALYKGNKAAARRARKAMQALSKLKKPFKDFTKDL